jgi:hypothetical protein
MEAAMTRTATHHLLIALAAFGLLSVFASRQASAQGHWDQSEGPRGVPFFPNQAGTAATQSKGLAAKKQSQRSRSISSSSVQQERSLSDEQ